MVYSLSIMEHTGPLSGITPEQVDRYLEILTEKNRLSAEWLEVEKAKSKPKQPEPFKSATEIDKPSGLGLTDEETEMLYFYDGGESVSPIKYLGKQNWLDINEKLKASGYSWVSKGKDSYWTRKG